MIASSSSSPPIRIDVDVTMPPSEMTATSVVPPPMSTIMLPVGLVDREPGADRGCHRLLDDVRAAAARGDRGLLDRALLDAGDARRDADDHARLREEPALVHPLDEVAEHLLGDVEVGDHAVLQGANRLDVARRAADHALGLGADREDRAGERVDRDDGGLVQDDAASADVDERVRGPEVDGHVATQEPEHPFRPPWGRDVGEEGR